MSCKDYDIIIKDGVLCTPGTELNVPKGLGHYIIEGCNKFSKNIFQICQFTNASITYSDFKIQSLNLAANLRHLCGVQPGDIVMTSMKNSLVNSLPVAAAFYLNAVTSSIDPTISARDCEYLINLAQPKIIIVDAEVQEKIEEAIQNLTLKPKLIVNCSQPASESNEHLHLQNLLLSTEISTGFEPVIVKDSNKSMAAILFSSGTTGFPKGICLNHQSVYFAGVTMHELMDMPQVYLLCTTFYWISGLGMFAGQFIKGSSKVALKTFDIHEFSRLCIQNKVEGTFLATSYLSKLLQYKDLVNQTPLKSLIAGGMMANKGQFAVMQSTFPQINFNQVYGMTECGGPICAFTANYRHDIKKFPESTGPPIEGFSIKIVDSETGKILGPNQQGEIYCKSKYSMMGYYRNDVDQAFDKDGFIKSGDLGYYNENKMIFISGRSKDMFKYQSWHIVPASLESIILECDGVDEAIVFGIPHEEDGFLPSAAVTLHKKMRDKIKPEDIANFVAERVADRQRLRGGVYILTDFQERQLEKSKK
ncbi:luciferin 4-monooxygenase-like [Atheta coriaria]|uniref:luciferin 4-monooxygenase-like n=1 Tax=Dalotia coriaria TaxID=877792 RepID=UPI0031F3F85E